MLRHEVALEGSGEILGGRIYVSLCAWVLSVIPACDLILDSGTRLSQLRPKFGRPAIRFVLDLDD